MQDGPTREGAPPYLEAGKRRRVRKKRKFIAEGEGGEKGRGKTKIPTPPGVKKKFAQKGVPVSSLVLERIREKKKNTKPCTTQGLGTLGVVL